jgi:hypothetical protein
VPDPPATPWQEARNRAERTGIWPEDWGPFHAHHRHFASDAIHRDGGPECDQPGIPRRVYVFDAEYLHAHEMAVARWAVEHPDWVRDYPVDPQPPPVTTSKVP